MQKRGDSVRVLALRDEDTSRLEQQGIEVHRGDVRDPKSLVAPTEGVDRLVHLAALMGVWRPMEDYRLTSGDADGSLGPNLYGDNVGWLLRMDA